MSEAKKLAHSDPNSAYNTSEYCERLRNKTPEWLERIRQARLGTTLSEEVKQALECEPGCTCGKHSEETLERNRQSQLGNQNRLVDGRTLHPQYNRWYNMIGRCDNSLATGYHLYGGRGITVCEEWYDPFVFYAYLETLLGWQPGYTLDRIDNEGNYEPGNIRWASQSEQNYNRRGSRV